MRLSLRIAVQMAAIPAIFNLHHSVGAIRNFDDFITNDTNGRMSRIYMGVATVFVLFVSFAPFAFKACTHIHRSHLQSHYAAYTLAENYKKLLRSGTLKSFAILTLLLVAAPFAAPEEVECTDATLVWHERVAVGDYEFEATDFSVGSASEIRLGESVWALVTIYRNGSVLWRDVFETNKSVSNYFPAANESAYTFDLNCTRTYLENETDRIRIRASKIIVGSNPQTQEIDVSICIVEPPPPPMTFDEWLNNTFAISKSSSTNAYVREKVFIELKIINISMADRIEIVDFIPDAFVVNPDRDLFWNYSRSEYRYSVTPLVPGEYTLPAANASIWCNERRINVTSNAPEIVVHGPYVTIAKTAEVAGEIVNVTVNVSNTGDHVAIAYIFDSIPDGAELLEGVLDFDVVLNPDATEYTSGRANAYSIRIAEANGTVTLPRAFVHYQTSKQIDTTREYRPEATFDLEKYIDPKFYAARSRSSEIVIANGAVVESAPSNGSEVGGDAQPGGSSNEAVEEAVAGDSTGEMTDGATDAAAEGSVDESVDESVDATPEQETEAGGSGVVQRVKNIPGFGAIFTVACLITGYLIHRKYDII